jgi:hypothetical protein
VTGATVPVNAETAALTGVGFVVDVELVVAVELGCSVVVTGREDVVDSVEDEARRAVASGADDPHALVATSAATASALANR